MKALNFSLLPLLALSALLALPARAAERPQGPGVVITAEPGVSAQSTYFTPRPGTGRAPASMKPTKEQLAAANQALCKRLQPGDTVMLQNTLEELNDQVAKVADKFEDCSLRVKLEDGKKMFVKLPNLTRVLSPETDDKCGLSHETRICRGDQVYYPTRSSSLSLPEGEVKYVFKNDSLVVRDGADFVLDLPQVGKSVKCCVQRPDVCVGDYVHAEGYRLDKKFNFEGKIEKCYSQGVVLVGSDLLWKFPIDVNAVKKRIAGVEDEDPAVIQTRQSGRKLPVYSPEIEPADTDKANKALEAH